MQIRLWTLMTFVFVVMVGNTFGQAFENEYRDIGGSQYKRKGYALSMGATGGFVTDSILDPISGKVITKTRLSGPVPATVNARKIYWSNEVTTPAQTNIDTKPLEEYLLDSLKEVFKEFSIDSFTIKIKLKNLIIDEKGQVVYYEFEGLRGWQKDGALRHIGSGSIGDKLETLLSTLPPVTPAKFNGMAVPAYTGITLDYYEIELRKPNVTYRKTAAKGYEGMRSHSSK